jgi:hypothetical protein
MELTIIQEKESEAETLALQIRERVETLSIFDQASYDFAQSLNKAALESKKSFHVWFDPIDEASKKQRQATIAQGKKIDEPLDFVIKTIGGKSATYIRAEEARIAEEKRKAEAIARKAAEDAALVAAQALQAEGMTAAAEAVLDAPIVIEKVIIEAPAKAQGVSYRDNYSAEVVNLMELVKAVAEGKAPLYYLEANLTSLNTWARNSKGSEAMPGIRVLNNPTQINR